MKLARTYTAEEIASIVGGRVVGDSKREVTGINEIHKVVPGDLSFVDHPKYYDRCLNSDASVIAINAEVPFPEGKAIIVVDDPIACYNQLVTRFSPALDSHAWSTHSQHKGEGIFIDSTAHVGPGVHIGLNVVIGKNTVIHPNVTIYENTRIGDNVIIHSGTVIGSDAYYYKRYSDRYEKLLSSGRTIIENGVEVGPACTVARGVSGDTVLGEGTKLDAQVHIGHGVVVGKRCLFAAQVGIAGKTVIEDEVILWGQVGVSKDLTIGKGAVVLAQSGVSKTLAGGRTYFGSPAEEFRAAYRKEAKLRLLSRER